MRVWIDLANSPHPLLFAPIARRLEAEGSQVLITVRDHAQTVELARERWPDASVVGEPRPPDRAGRAREIVARMAALRRWARRARPDVALSHNSYAQLLAARTLRIPAVTAMDFEYQPANHLAFRAATRVLLPEAVPAAPVRRQGARGHKLVRYPGLKEQLYLGDFEPEPEILNRLGIDRQQGNVLVVARSSPAGAAYHPDENQLFFESLKVLDSQPQVRCIVLARHPEQRAQVHGLGLERCLVPEHAIDARSLMYRADLFLGAGGTMTREAALLGIPAYTLFASQRPAVDSWLARAGALRVLESTGQLTDLGPREDEPADLASLREAGRRIEEVFIEATMTVGRGS